MIEIIGFLSLIISFFIYRKKVLFLIKKDGLAISIVLYIGSFLMLIASKFLNNSSNSIELKMIKFLFNVDFIFNICSMIFVIIATLVLSVYVVAFCFENNK